MYLTQSLAICESRKPPTRVTVSLMYRQTVLLVFPGKERFALSCCSGVGVTINSRYSSDWGGWQLDSALTEVDKIVKAKRAIEVAENRGRDKINLYN
jgi:hypothetical protein